MHHDAHYFESQKHARHSHHADHFHGSTRRIFLAFLLSFAFSIIEFIGGLFTGSVAILSDSVHSFGDALSTGISCIFEYLDHRHSHTHERYSRMGAIFTTVVLFIASAILIYEAIERIITPAEVNYDGMILFAILGIIFNFFATLITRHGDSLNQKIVSLHMLEDCLTWVAVLIGAIVMRLTGIAIIDSILSIIVALVTLYYAFRNIILLRSPRK